MTQHRKKLLTISMLLLLPAVCLLVFGLRSRAEWLGSGAEAEEMPGAVDPSIPEVPVPPQAGTQNQKAELDVAVGSNVLVNSRTGCASGGVTQNETSVATDGVNVLVAYNDSRFRCNPLYAALGFSFSTDGGATFTQGTGLPRARDLDNGDPWVGVSPPDPVTGQRTFYMSGLYRSYSGFGFYHGTITSTGVVWAPSDPTIIQFPATGANMDKEAFAVDQTFSPSSGYIYFTYTDHLSSIQCTRSIDGGYTWDPPVIVYSGGGSQGSFPAVAADGTVFVAHRAAGVVRIARSFDQGQSFQNVASYTVSESGVQYMDRASDFPQVAIDMTDGAHAGSVYVVWHNVMGGYLRPVIVRSDDGGDTWTQPNPINTDTVNAPHWWPSVAIGTDGSVNVIFLDRRLNAGTGITNTFFARSTDGGNTFTNVRASDMGGNWQTIGHDGGFTWSGDYIRLITDGTDALATWADARNGDPDVYFARISGSTTSAARTQLR